MSSFKGQITLINVKDGAPGTPGAPGKEAQRYRIETNQDEILKFIDNNGNMSVSPSSLTLRILKKDLTNSEGEIEVFASPTNFKIYSYNVKNNGWDEFKNFDDFLVVDTGIEGENTQAFRYYLKIDNIIKYSKMKEEDIEPVWNNLVNTESAIYIKFSIADNNETYTAEKIIGIRYGMNRDMAQLSLWANGIYAAVQNSQLEFDANGLKIKNGSFEIVDNQNQPLLYSENGNLMVRGVLSGATGSFKGAITATEGTIGGFKIADGQLISTESDSPSITLDGKNGQIIANNIKLGIGAEINEYLKLGDNVKILNPSSNDRTFLKVFKTENEKETSILDFKDSGILTIGNGGKIITINGQEGTISSEEYSENLGWKLSSDEAIFNNIVAKGSIKASVFEYGKIQAVGGILLVRPSSRIISVSGSQLILETAEGFSKDDVCMLDAGPNGGKKYFTILEVENNMINLDTTEDLASFEGGPIINFGQIGSVGIGINGSTNGSFIDKQAISVFEFSLNNGNYIPVPKIILGKLPDADQYGPFANTYGLYAENVLLKGSLVTQTDSSTYSGISTLYSGENSPTSAQYKEYFGENNTGEILLWAGAEGTAKNDIEKSKFFVDKNGNLVAHSGYFEGTIITNAKISASEIITATLTGNGSGPALVIRDAKSGIVFKNENSEIFSLEADSIKANVKEVIFNQNFKIDESGKVTIPQIKIGNNNHIEIIGDKISNNFGGAISFTNDKINFNIDENLILDLSNNSTFKSSLLVESTLTANERLKLQNICEYIPVKSEEKLIGYDLYVY